MQSPLRYPGGKSWLVRDFLRYMRMDTQEVLSPFLGGGAIELNLALMGKKIYAYDICPNLINFWQHWIDSPFKIEQDAKKLLEGFNYSKLKQIKTNFNFKGYEGAVYYYACNRISFGGVVWGSHVRLYEKVDGKFVYPLHKNQTSRRNVFPFTHLWRILPRVNIHVGIQDFKSSLEMHPDIFTYLDPPYVGTEDLYGLKDFDHIGLYNILHTRRNWILSYNDSEMIRQLYADYKRIKYASRNFNTSKMEPKDLVILSQDIASNYKGIPEQLNLFSDA